MAAFTLVLAGAVLASAGAQTYTITDVSPPPGNPSFAPGVNANGQVSGYSTVGASGARAWRFTAGFWGARLGILWRSGFAGARDQ